MGSGYRVVAPGNTTKEWGEGVPEDLYMHPFFYKRIRS